jgi:hypothetical protein
MGKETGHQDPHPLTLPLPFLLPPPLIFTPITHISKQDNALGLAPRPAVMVPAKEKIVNGGIKRVRKAMAKGTNALSEGEMHFIRTCCRILKVNEKEKIHSIGAKAMKDSRKKGTSNHEHH